MISAPLPPDEAARLDALSECRILDTLPEKKFDGVVWRWTTWTATPHAGERLIYAAGRDVTEERLTSRAIAESEERYRDLFENATDMIQSVDATGKFLYVNRAWLQTLGYESADLRSLTMFDVIDPKCRQHCAEMLERVMSGQPLPKVVTVFRTRAGERRIVEGTVNCRQENGRPVSTRGIFRDVTEQKKAEEEVRASESAMRSIRTSTASTSSRFCTATRSSAGFHSSSTAVSTWTVTTVSACSSEPRAFSRRRVVTTIRSSARS